MKFNFYEPLKTFGIKEKVPIHLWAYHCNGLWPLNEDATRFQLLAKYAILALSVSCFTCTIFEEIQFLTENTNNIPALTLCLSTTLVGIQFLIRMIVLAMTQNRMYDVFTHFYKEIYFTANDDQTFYKNITKYTSFVSFFTKFYSSPCVFIIVMFMYEISQQDLFSNTKPYIYALSIRWYDAQQPIAYIITCFYTLWLTPSCGILMAADDYFLCIMLCHTSYRYKQLQLELQQLHTNTKRDSEMATTQDLHAIFRQKLYDIFKREQQLKRFVMKAKKHYRHQIFYCLSFGVGLLCVLMFEFHRSTIGMNWMKFIVWLIAQTAEFIMVGYFGQMLMDESAAMKNSYYMCEWEQLLTHGNSRSNKALMKDITFAILNTDNCIAVFDGIKIIPLTHSTVGAALRSAMSYFMFLNTMNDGGHKSNGN